MNLNKYKIIILFLITLLFFSSIYSVELKSAFNFTFKDKLGKQITLKEYSKNNTTIIFFWSVCCAKEELPVINQLFKKYDERGLNLVLISTDKGASLSKAKNFLKMANIKGKAIFDKNGKIYRKYRGGFTKPVFLIINKEMKIEFRHDGHASKQFYEKAIMKYLK